MQPNRRSGQALDARYRERGQDPAAGPAYRRGHRRDAGLTLGSGGSPAAPADLGQRGGGEFAPRSPRCMRLPSSQASRTWAAEPAVIGSAAPTGTVSRSPLARSAAATQMRVSACGRYSSRTLAGHVPSRARTGWAMASSRSSPAAAASSPILGPSTNRPCASRASIRWVSNATAIRCTVGRARPVALTSWASEGRAFLQGRQYGNGLARTPTPLELFMFWNTAVSKCETQVKGESVMGRTLAEKIWDAHVVHSADGLRDSRGEPDLLYIDLHLVHEVTSPQAFDGLRADRRTVRRPDLTIATEDHNVPTTGIIGSGVSSSTSPVPLFGPGSPATDPCRARRSRRCARTAPSSASGCTPWATRARASCTSSARRPG